MRTVNRPLLALGACAALMLVGCQSSESADASSSMAMDNSRNPHVQRAESSQLYMYEYYPDAQLYVDNQRGLYFWRANGRWQQSAELPRGIVFRSTNHVTVPLQSDNPGPLHSSVASMYPAGSVVSAR